MTGVNGSEKFWRGVIIALVIVCLIYMLVALWIGLRQFGGDPIKFDPLSWPVELFQQLPGAPDSRPAHRDFGKGIT